MADIYLSFAQLDCEIARGLAALLESNGFAVWWNKESIPPGQDVQAVVAKERDNAKVVIALLSPAALQSNDVANDMELAHEAGKLIPVRVQDLSGLDMPSFLMVALLVDVHNSDALLKAVTRRMNEKRSPLPMSGPRTDYRFAARRLGDEARASRDLIAGPVGPVNAASQEERDALYRQRMAKDDVPPTLGSTPIAPDILNDRLTVDTMLSLTAQRKAVAVGAAAPQRRPDVSPLQVGASPTEPPRNISTAPRLAPASTRPPSPPEMPAKGGSGALVEYAIPVGLIALIAYMSSNSWGQDLFGKLIAFINIKHNAFTFFGLLSRSKATAPPEAQADLVDCSVFAPPAAPPGATVMVQVFLHVPEHAERARFLATVMDHAASLKGVQTLQTEIRRGARVAVTLSAEGLSIGEPHQTLVWNSQPVFAQFLVTLPEGGASAATYHPVVRIIADGGLIGRIAFAIATDAEAGQAQSRPTGESARRYRHAFLSYASPDRKEVLKRAQALKAVNVSFFQDTLSLDPGARWEKAIYKNIDDCDLFLLFWSKAAADSQWVVKEAEYALARQIAGQKAGPDIVPVLLEGPPPVAPPQSLAAIHFNDPILYHIAGG